MSYKATIVMIFIAFTAGLWVCHRFAAPDTVVAWKDRIVTVTHTIIKPDGTQVSDSTSRQVNTGTLTKTLTKPNWAVGLNYYSISEYGITVDKRMFGDVWLTSGITQKQLSVGIKYEF